MCVPGNLNSRVMPHIFGSKINYFSFPLSRELCVELIAVNCLTQIHPSLSDHRSQLLSCS